VQPVMPSASTLSLPPTAAPRTVSLSLILAARHGHTGTVGLLLAMGASLPVSPCLHPSASPLLSAVHGGHTATVSALLDTDECSAEDVSLALCMACMLARAACCALLLGEVKKDQLLSVGVSVGDGPGQRHSLLSLALLSGDPETVQLVLRLLPSLSPLSTPPSVPQGSMARSVSVAALGQDTVPPYLHCALIGGHPLSVIEELVSLSPALTGDTHLGSSVLDTAIALRRVDVFEYILSLEESEGKRAKGKRERGRDKGGRVVRTLTHVRTMQSALRRSVTPMGLMLPVGVGQVLVAHVPLPSEVVVQDSCLPTACAARQAVHPLSDYAPYLRVDEEGMPEECDDINATTLTLNRLVHRVHALHPFPFAVSSVVHGALRTEPYTPTHTAQASFALTLSESAVDRDRLSLPGGASRTSISGVSIGSDAAALSPGCNMSHLPSADRSYILSQLTMSAGSRHIVCAVIGGEAGSQLGSSPSMSQESMCDMCVREGDSECRAFADHVIPMLLTHGEREAEREGGDRDALKTAISALVPSPLFGVSSVSGPSDDQAPCVTVAHMVCRIGAATALESLISVLVNPGKLIGSGETTPPAKPSRMGTLPMGGGTLGLGGSGLGMSMSMSRGSSQRVLDGDALMILSMPLVICSGNHTPLAERVSGTPRVRQSKGSRGSVAGMEQVLTCMDVAVSRHHSKCISVLMRAGMKPKNPATKLVACVLGNEYSQFRQQLAGALCEDYGEGSPFTSQCPVSGLLPMHGPAITGNADTCSAIVAESPLGLGMGPGGMTPLHMACLCGSDTVIAVLLGVVRSRAAEYGPILHSQCDIVREGQAVESLTPLQCALRETHDKAALLVASFQMEPEDSSAPAQPTVSPSDLAYACTPRLCHLVDPLLRACPGRVDVGEALITASRHGLNRTVKTLLKYHKASRQLAMEHGTPEDAEAEAEAEQQMYNDALCAAICGIDTRCTLGDTALQAGCDINSAYTFDLDNIVSTLAIPSSTSMDSPSSPSSPSRQSRGSRKAGHRDKGRDRPDLTAVLETLLTVGADCCCDRAVHAIMEADNAPLLFHFLSNSSIPLGWTDTGADGDGESTGVEGDNLLMCALRHAPPSSSLSSCYTQDHSPLCGSQSPLRCVSMLVTLAPGLMTHTTHSGSHSRGGSSGTSGASVSPGIGGESGISMDTDPVRVVDHLCTHLVLDVVHVILPHLPTTMK
ncbi:hypothetical protein KIPB_006967, partial [Kipferlia bialata]